MTQSTTPPPMSPGASLAHRASVALMGVFVLIATGDGFAQSYAGLYHWATQHSLHGWKAQAFPLMVDLFILVGELGLFALALEGHKLTRRGLSWIDLGLPFGIAAAGWTVSLLFNIGAVDGLAVKATHAVPPIASMLGLLVLLRTLHRLVGRTPSRTAAPMGQRIPQAAWDRTLVARMRPPSPRTPARAALPHATVRMVARTAVLAPHTGAPAHPPAARTEQPRTAPAQPRADAPHADNPAHADDAPHTGRADSTTTPRTRPARGTRTATAAKPRTPDAEPAQTGNVTPIGGAAARTEWAKTIAEEILAADGDGRTWEPDYDDLTQRTKFKRRWCEARVSEAREVAARMRDRSTPARGETADAPHADEPAHADHADDEDEPARDWAPLRTDARTADAG